MERFTISLDDKLALDFDALVARRGCSTRSEAVRDLLRGELERTNQQEVPDGECVACLSYVFSHHERDLAERLTGMQHDHHDLAVSTMHVHLDHDHCLETVILRGDMQAVRDFAAALCAERGVHHGNVNVVRVVTHKPHTKSRRNGVTMPSHFHRDSNHPHLHFKPAT